MTIREWGETIGGRRKRKNLWRGKKKPREKDEITSGRREEKAREIRGTQIVRHEKGIKRGVIKKGIEARQILSQKNGARL